MKTELEKARNGYALWQEPGLAIGGSGARRVRGYLAQSFASCRARGPTSEAMKALALQAQISAIAPGAYRAW